jgi:hypothetical protein
MIERFPYKITVEHGYTAIITNPTKGLYHFEVIEPANAPSFDWNEQIPEEETERYRNEGSLDIVEHYLLHGFFALQRN